MSIKHKFIEKDFEKGFYTQNAILKNDSFKPEVLFLGTFNPKTNEKDNPADFFYGRNWFWPLLFSIAKDDDSPFKQRKTINPPTLEDILDFTLRHKISFADLICEVLPNKIEKIDYGLAKNKVIYGNDLYDLINDKDLIKLHKKNEIIWNEQILNFIKENESIETVYFTRKSTKPFAEILNKVNTLLKDRGAEIKFLYTPSGQGLKGKPRYKKLKEEWLNSTREGFHPLNETWVKCLRDN